MSNKESIFLNTVLIVGLVRNGANDLESNLSQLSRAFSNFSEVHWLIVESDSSDSTVDILMKASKKISNFKYLSLGDLSEMLPSRTERLAHCRNTYLKEIRENIIYSNINYVIVSDLDNTNSLLSEEAILSCWLKDDWDVCTANQCGPYYDIWALRHPFWSPGDCWLEHRFLSQFSKRSSLDILDASIYSKMIEIPVELDWIEVDSAFGGLAIYKKSIMNYGHYIGLYQNGMELSEHIPFHLVIRENGGKIFINPKLINTDYTEHSLPLKKSIV